MKKTDFYFFVIPLVFLMALVFSLVTCEMVTSVKEFDRAAVLKSVSEPAFSRIPQATLSAEVCCTGTGSAANVVDGSSSTYWGTDYDGSGTEKADYTSGFHAHASQHYITIDLGRTYENVSRIVFIPYYNWTGPGGYMYGTNQLRSGIPRQFEIYVTDEKLERLEKPPAEDLAAYGEWRVWDPAGNSVHANESFTVSFSSKRGRYLQFRFVTTYFDHWSGYPDVAKIAAAADIQVYESLEPYVVDRGDMADLIEKANDLRNAYLPMYGYTNSILNNWVGKADEMVKPDNRASREFVNEIMTNLRDYVNSAPTRMQAKKYDRLTPKIMWADDKGNHLQAHGGGILWDPVTKKWWLYGEDRTGGGGGQPGVHAYSSDDLYNWKDENLALPVFNNTQYNTLGWEKGEWEGHVWDINQWRKSLGDWNCDGVIGNAGDSPTALETTEIIAGRFPTPSEALDKIKDFIPDGNPPLYVASGTDAQPYASFLGLTSGRVAAFNALYEGMPVWRKKQLYRFYNFQTTIERPKVIYNATANPYTENGKQYRYVMFVHLEGGFFRSNYGTAKVLIAVAQNAAGPYKALWGYHTNFPPGYTNTTSHMGMTRDQNVVIDSDGTAYHFGSTQENRVMGINKLDPTYTQILGVPRFQAGESQAEMLQEGYTNQLAVNFNLVYGDQREAPAPFVHYETANMNLDGTGTTYTLWNGSTYTSVAPNNANKRYYCITSTSTGWFTNPQGIYRTSRPGDSILGANPHPLPTGGTAYTTGTTDGSAPGNVVNTGSGWTTVAGNSANSLLYGDTNDGTTSGLGFDGQTTNVTQLRYPEHPWGIIGFDDPAFWATGPNPEDYPGDPAGYYAALDAAAGSFSQPVYGERTELDEPRKGMLVYGKYIYQADSWDQYKNYDARYIWLPMRARSGTNNDTTNGAKGVRVRWMNQWRWQDFVYDIGPFADSLNTSAALWVTQGQTALTAYDFMLNGYK
jgi:hypothetical protein